MADAGTVLSRGNSCPLSCHRPSQRLPWPSCRKALHLGEQLTEFLGIGNTHFPKPWNSSLEGRQRREAGTRTSLSAGSTPLSRREGAPCQKISAGPSSRFARLSERNLVCPCWRALA